MSEYDAWGGPGVKMSQSHQLDLVARLEKVRQRAAELVGEVDLVVAAIDARIDAAARHLADLEKSVQVAANAEQTLRDSLRLPEPPPPE